MADEEGPMERLVSADSHVHFTDDWVKARLSSRLASIVASAAAQPTELFSCV